LPVAAEQPSPSADKAPRRPDWKVDAHGA
jgi:hypothetical protein